MSRRIAIAVGLQAQAQGHAPVTGEAELTAAVDGAMWQPEYRPYVPAP